MNRILLISIILFIFIVVNRNIKDNFISFNTKTLNGKLEDETLFKNFHTIKTFNTIPENVLPRLTFHSYESCPTLYKLFMGLSSLNDKENDLQIENTDGLNFRSKIISRFYNIKRFVRPEHNILDIDRKFLPVTIKSTIVELFEHINDFFGIEEAEVINEVTEEAEAKEYYDIKNGEINEKIIGIKNILAQTERYFKYLSGKIPKVQNDNFIELIKILIEEYEKIEKILNFTRSHYLVNSNSIVEHFIIKDLTKAVKNIDSVVSLSYSNIEEAAIAAKERAEATRSATRAAEIAAATAATRAAIRAAREAEIAAEIAAVKEKVVIEIKNLENSYLNENEKDAVERIKFKLDNNKFVYIIEDLFTLEILDREKFDTLIKEGYKFLKEKMKEDNNDSIKNQINSTLKDYIIPDFESQIEYIITEETKTKIRTLKEELKELEFDDEGSNKMNLINPNFTFNLAENEEINYDNLNHIEQKSKQVLFDVKVDFTEEDVIKFTEYCFMYCCFGIIDIDLLSLTSNHYRVLPCFNHKKNSKGMSDYYYILPERIRSVAMEEGSEYTRAKCNGCASNIIVFFNKIPDKFKHYKKLMQKKKNKYIKDIISS